MNIFYAIFMGILQGLTEFLPVSSSGHLAILSRILDIGENALSFSIMLHAGTLVAVCVAYRQDIADILTDIGHFAVSLRHPAERRRSNGGLKLALLVLLSLVPLFFIVPFKDKLEAAFSSTLVTGCMLLLTAALLFIADILVRRPQNSKGLERAKWYDALIVGIFQMCALMPGLSRSGTTITGGLFCKFDRRFAVRFSFLMSIPTIAAALLLDLKDMLTEGFDTSLLLPGAVGMLIAGVTGYFAIGFLKKLASSGRFSGFAIYCTAIGLLTIILSLI